MAKMTSPLYEPLVGEKVVRFLRLLPGELHEDISIELFHDTLVSHPPCIYEATSYTWGTPTPTRTILCNGHEINLRRNAYDFLLRLRLRGESRVLWMDCLCIDQDNLQERSQQVEIMHLIYRLAKAVLVWLGPGSDNSALAMDYVSRLEPRKYLDEMQRRDPQERDRDKKFYLFDTLDRGQENKCLVHALADLFCRSWLSRVWVLQEAIMCTETRVFCGSREASWDAFASLAWLLRPRGYDEWPDWTECDFWETVWPGVDSVYEMQRYRLSHLQIPDIWAAERFEEGPIADPAVPLSDLEKFVLDDDARDGCKVFRRYRFDIVVAAASKAKATDPRDKVYALFNVADFTSNQLRDRPPIDYTIPWQKAYIRTTKWMHANKWIITLEMAGRCLQQNADLPSWVPDWRRNVRVGGQLQHSQWFAGGGAYPPHPRFINIPNGQPEIESMPVYFYTDIKGRKKRIPLEGLELTAILQDRIAYTSPGNWPDVEFIDDITDRVVYKVDSDLRYIQQHVPKYFTGECGEDAYAATMIANTTHDFGLARPEYERNGFAEWQRWLRSGIPDPYPAYHDAIRSAGSITSKYFCMTSHGIMCLAPSITRAGDYVGILSGFKWPVALRKVGPYEKPYYELLGPCYVHRMMRSRAWNLIYEFKCKHIVGSENEAPIAPPQPRESTFTPEQTSCEGFPFNPKDDYASVVRVLGKRRIVLV